MNKRPLFQVTPRKSAADLLTAAVWLTGSGAADINKLLNTDPG